jgi:hypothetical protein
MASDNTQSSATKQDIALLMEEIGKLYDANQRWKDEIIQKTGEWKDEIISEFKLVAEDMHHDLHGVTKDRFEGHEQRIVRLEKHTKLVLV